MHEIRIGGLGASAGVRLTATARNGEHRHAMGP